MTGGKEKEVSCIVPNYFSDQRSQEGTFIFSHRLFFVEKRKGLKRGHQCKLREGRTHYILRVILRAILLYVNWEPLSFFLTLTFALLFSPNTFLSLFGVCVREVRERRRRRRYPSSSSLSICSYLSPPIQFFSLSPSLALSHFEAQSFPSQSGRPAGRQGHTISSQPLTLLLISS